MYMSKGWKLYHNPFIYEVRKHFKKLFNRNGRVIQEYMINNEEKTIWVYCLTDTNSPRMNNCLISKHEHSML